MGDDRTAAAHLATALGLVAATALGVAVQAIRWTRAFFHDDAFITLRYAQNWLAGNGIAWNPGDRVEGYTNFLQLVLVAGLGALGVDLMLATHLVAGAALTGLLAFGAAWLPRAPDRTDMSARRRAFAVSLPLAATAACVPLIGWCFGGLEAPLLALLLTLGTVGLRDALWAPAGTVAAPLTAGAKRLLAGCGLAFGLACLTRLDAGLFVAAAVPWVLLRAPRGARARTLSLFALPLSALLLPWLAWKLAYYGALLPNTFHAKVAAPSDWRLAAGLAYAAAFVSAPPFPLLWLAAGALRAVQAQRFALADGFGLAVVALQLGWVAFVGGDQMPLFRLLVPLAPIAAWLAFRLWQPELAALSKRGVVVVAACVAGALALQLSWPSLAGPHRNSTSFVGAAVGRHIAQTWRPGALVALNTAGSTPYYAPSLRYLDMLGLNDAHIARREIRETRTAGQRIPGHAKGDGAYVLAHQPDYVILGPAAGVSARHPWFLSDLELAEDSAFARGYVLRRKTLDVTDLAGFEEIPETRAGTLVFHYYERIGPLRTDALPRRPGRERGAGTPP
jgi:hypothetical protein